MIRKESLYRRQPLPFGEASSGSYTVKLNSQPTQGVTVTPASGNTGVAEVSAPLLFTTSNWNMTKTVTVTGVNDNIINASARATTITHTILGGDYTTLDIANKTVAVTLTDDDTKGVTISETTLAFGEASSGSYTVKLNSQPTQDVTVTPASGNTGVAEVSAPLLFTTSNWDIAKTVTVTGVNDNIINASARATTITHTILGGDYTTLDIANKTVAVTLTDDDTGGVTLSVNSLTVGESGPTGSYTVVLTVQPSGNVVVTPASGNTGAATVSGGPLTFDSSNWTTPQRVTVTGGE